MNYWMVKQEPEAYSFDDFLKDKKTDWTGVRNFQARNNLRAMKKGDEVFYYHSVTGKSVVGVARGFRFDHQRLVHHDRRLGVAELGGSMVDHRDQAVAGERVRQRE